MQSSWLWHRLTEENLQAHERRQPEVLCRQTSLGQGNLHCPTQAFPSGFATAVTVSKLYLGSKSTPVTYTNAQ